MIHFLQFTNGNCHPSLDLSASPYGTIALKHRGWYKGTQMETMGRNLVVLLAHSENQALYLINWARCRIDDVSAPDIGRQLLKQLLQTICFKPYTYYPALTSISENLFMLAYNWGLELWEIKEGESGSSVLAMCCKLELPPVQRKAKRKIAICKKAPAVDGPAISGELPFRSSPSTSVLTLQVEVGQRKWLVCFLSGSLTTMATPKLPNHNILIPWGDWVPESTRWLSFSSPNLKCSSSGMRVSFVDEDTLHLLDFNPHRLRRVCALSKWE